MNWLRVSARRFRGLFAKGARDRELHVGIAVGMVLALVAARGAGSLLYGIQPADSFTMVGASVFLAGVALAASFIPARRATRVDPMIALRYE